MLRTPFHLPTTFRALTVAHAWVGEVTKNPLPLPAPNREYLLQIGTEAGIITEGGDKDFLEGLRKNLLADSDGL